MHVYVYVLNNAWLIILILIYICKDLYFCYLSTSVNFFALIAWNKPFLNPNLLYWKIKSGKRLLLVFFLWWIPLQTDICGSALLPPTGCLKTQHRSSVFHVWQQTVIARLCHTRSTFVGWCLTVKINAF